MTQLTTILAPTSQTLARYGFGCGPFALSDSPVDDWLELLDSQGGVCGVCGQVPTPNAETGKVRFVIDHEHVRGWKKMPPEQRRAYVRGLTCWWCNSTYLGRGVNVSRALGVARFLSRYERKPDPLAVAWAAGLFEGEGCISTYNNGQSAKRYWQLELRMTDEDIVRRLHEVLGVGSVYGPYEQKASTKPFWQLNVRKQEEVRQVLELLYPYLGERRRARADEALS